MKFKRKKRISKKVKGGIAKIVTVSILIIFALAIAFVTAKTLQDHTTSATQTTANSIDDTMNTENSD